MRRYAVIPTRDRNQWAYDLGKQLLAQDCLPVFIDNNDPGNLFSPPHGSVFLDYHPEAFNYSQAVNVGLNWVADQKRKRNEEYTVAVLNDDVSIPEDFMNTMEVALEECDVDVASPGEFFIEMRHGPRQIPLHLRPQGWCWATRGSAGIRLDEDLKIWYNDDDVWQQALCGRGYVLLQQMDVKHLDANGNFNRNPEWQIQAGLDRETFKEKWSFYAW